MTLKWPNEVSAINMAFEIACFYKCHISITNKVVYLQELAILSYPPEKCTYIRAIQQIFIRKIILWGILIK